MSLLGFSLALMPFLFWGVADYFSAKSARKITPISTNFIFTLIGLIIPALVCGIKGFPDISISIIAKYFLSSVFLSAGFLSMVKGFSSGELGIVAPIANAYAIVTLLVSVLFFSEKLIVGQLLIVLLVIAGIAIISYEKNTGKSKLHLGPSVLYGLASLLSFGVGFALINTFEALPWYQRQFLLSVSGITIASLLMVFFWRGRIVQSLKMSLTNRYGIMGGLLGGIGVCGLFAAIENLDSVVIPTVVASGAPLVTVYLAHKLEHEHIELYRRVGIAVVVSGVVLLNLL